MPEKNPAGGLPCRPAIELRVSDRLNDSRLLRNPEEKRGETGDGRVKRFWHNRSSLTTAAG